MAMLQCLFKRTNDPRKQGGAVRLLRRCQQVLPETEKVARLARVIALGPFWRLLHARRRPAVPPQEIVGRLAQSD